MRAVTFAQTEVVDYLHRNFISTWYNQQPRVYPPTSPAAVNDHIACGCLASHGIAKGARQEALRRPDLNLPPGTGAGNVKIFFCTADAAIVNYLQGHWTPKEFVQHADFALALLKLHGSSPSDREAMTKLHRECKQVHVEASRKAQQELQASPAQRKLVEEVNAQNIRAQCHDLSIQRLLQDPQSHMREDLRILR